MKSLDRDRDFAVEREERNTFVLLQHAYTLAEADPEVRLSGWHLGDALGLPREEAGRLIRHLVWHGYLEERGAGPEVSVTPQGVDYIERLAWRRQSVRVPEAWHSYES